MFTVRKRIQVTITFRQDTDVIAGNWMNTDWKKPIGEIRESLRRGSIGPANESLSKANNEVGIILNFPEGSPWEGYYRIKESSTQAAHLASDMHTSYIQMMRLFGIK